ncbi:MAG: endonuclease [Alphaproteobacteria bacterium]|nr:endonuclease [Alphaproteobacteria bacterium]MAS48012.1 endonuclease [Alphaproteobacteria bacterium]
MFTCEQDLLKNLIVLSPKNARREFRQRIFEEWNWKCAYCDKHLTTNTATIDHIVPKYRGGHNTKSNMCCCCSDCNKDKATTPLEQWYISSYIHYSETRLDKIKSWMEHNSLKLLSTDKTSPNIDNEFCLSWSTS